MPFGNASAKSVCKSGAFTSGRVPSIGNVYLTDMREIATMHIGYSSRCLDQLNKPEAAACPSTLNRASKIRVSLGSALFYADGVATATIAVSRLNTATRN